MKSTIIILFLLLGYTSVFAQQGYSVKTTRVTKYVSGVYGDSSDGLCSGKIALNVSSGTPYYYDKIFITSVNQITKDTDYFESDYTGLFVAGLKQGYYTIIVHKSGYQPLVIKNFRSRPHYVLNFEAIFETGKDEKTYTLSDDGSVLKN